MRHLVQKRHFNRDTNHRKHLLRNLVRSLVEMGEITTTVAKAKETKRISDKLISRAGQNTLATRRVLHRFFGKRDVVNTLVESIAPAMADRKSGFTTLTKVGKRRGDNTEMAKLSLVIKPENLGTLKSKKESSKSAEPEKKSATPSKKAVVKAKAETAKKVTEEKSVKPVKKSVEKKKSVAKKTSKKSVKK